MVLGHSCIRFLIYISIGSSRTLLRLGTVLAMESVHLPLSIRTKASNLNILLLVMLSAVDHHVAEKQVLRVLIKSEHKKQRTII